MKKVNLLPPQLGIKNTLESLNQTINDKVFKEWKRGDTKNVNFQVCTHNSVHNLTSKCPVSCAKLKTTKCIQTPLFVNQKAKVHIGGFILIVSKKDSNQI